MGQTTIITRVVFGAILLLGVGHFVGITVAAIQRDPFIYDFRFYSELLVGGLLVAPSLYALRHSRDLRNGSRAAWRSVFAASLVILAVNLPLIPTELALFPFESLELAMGMVAFGTIVSLLAAVNAASLLALRRKFSVRRAAR